MMSNVGQLPKARSGALEQDLATAVLQLVVQHADVEQQQVAAWLRLSKSVRTALQQSIGSLSVETSKRQRDPRDIRKHMTALAHWLPRHAGLVSTLVLWRGNGTYPSEAEWAAFEEMLSLSLQASCSSRPAYGIARTQGPTRPLLQLGAFRTNFVFQPAALEAFASSSSSRLTQLSLAKVPPECFTAELCTALGSLRGLRRLTCYPQDPSAPDDAVLFPPEFAKAVAQLTQLEQLAAEGLVCTSSLALLPASLTDLSVDVIKLQLEASEAAGWFADIHMSHLSNLQSLFLNVPDGISAQSQLPAGLTQLTIVGRAEALGCLPELQSLHVPKAHAGTVLLLHLGQQPKLQRLSLGLYGCNMEELQHVADGVSRCKQLTALHLFHKYLDIDSAPYIEDRKVVDMHGVLVRLQGLRQLQQLNLSQIKWDFEGFSQLTVLSSLTKLKLDSCDIDASGLAVVFQRLTGLRGLDMMSCLPPSKCLLVAMACLTNLETLALLNHQPMFSDATLPLLSPLTKLTYLSLAQPEPNWDDSSEMDSDLDDEYMVVSAPAQRQFLSGMPHLSTIDWT